MADSKSTFKNAEKTPNLSRRRLLSLGISLGATVVFGKLATACSSSDDGTGATNTDDAGTGTGDTGTTTSTEDAAAEATNTVDAAGIPWATGGTAAMKDKATYPNPFTTVPSSCAASCELTEGPCYSAQSVEIQDISYGFLGLPTRLYLRILDESCKPVSGATVDVWHVAPNGKYSGNDSAHENVAFCTANDADMTSHLYFRGKQTTDANGIVFFDTCFPGWYASRTIHIHMTISVGATAYVTTQFGFDDTLDNEIVSTQDLYSNRGGRDTTNATDTVLPATGLSDYLFDTQKMTDGAMLASKTIILRSALTETLCSPAGAGGGGGPPGGGGGGPGGGDGGGPPPEGGPGMPPPG